MTRDLQGKLALMMALERWFVRSCLPLEVGVPPADGDPCVVHLYDAVCLRQGVLHLLQALVHVPGEPVGAAQVTGEGEGGAELGHGHI